MLLFSITLLIVSGLTAGYTLFNKSTTTTKTAQKNNSPLNLFSPLAEETPPEQMILELESLNSEENSEVLPDNRNLGKFHILLLGLDKRTPNQTNYRTDAIMLVSVNEKTKKVLLTSIPRDLYVGGAKLNAHFCNEGFDAFKERIGNITGITPTHYISADFDSMVWAVNRLGGLEPNIERTFIDPNYPADRPNAPHPPTFQAGLRELEGEKALQFCRSRKGTAGEGSDFRRMARQQTLLESAPLAFETSDLFHMSTEALHRLLTGHMETNISLGTAARLLPLLKNWRDYQIENLILDDQNYLYNPPSTEYGGAYVLRPKGNSYTAIKSRIAGTLQASSGCTSCGN